MLYACPVVDVDWVKCLRFSFGAGVVMPNLQEVQAMCEKAQACVRKRKFDDAITLFRKVIESDARHGDAHEGLATALFLSGRNAEARDAFEQATRVDPRRGRATRRVKRI